MIHTFATGFVSFSVLFLFVMFLVSMWKLFIADATWNQILLAIVIIFGAIVGIYALGLGVEALVKVVNQ